jgi:hypothetical protein
VDRSGLSDQRQLDLPTDDNQICRSAARRFPALRLSVTEDGSVTDAQVRRLREKRMDGKTVGAAAAAAGMCERTARHWQEGPFPWPQTRSGGSRRSPYLTGCATAIPDDFSRARCARCSGACGTGARNMVRMSRRTLSRRPPRLSSVYRGRGAARHPRRGIWEQPPPRENRSWGILGGFSTAPIPAIHGSRTVRPPVAPGSGFIDDLHRARCLALELPYETAHCLRLARQLPRHRRLLSADQHGHEQRLPSMRLWHLRALTPDFGGSVHRVECLSACSTTTPLGRVGHSILSRLDLD